MTFLPADLGLTDTALSQITAQRANAGLAAPVTDIIAGQLSFASGYTARWDVPDATLRPLVRALALWELLSPIGAATEDHRRSYDDALRVLEAIRDGKFANFAPAAVPPAGLAARGQWGSRKNIL